MKKLFSSVSCILLLLISISAASAQYRADTNRDNGKSKVGIGFILGEPTGLSLKAWTSDKTAFDLGLAWSFGRYEAINIHADHLWHNASAYSEEIEQSGLPIYYGVGGRLVLADNNSVLGARFPLGLNWLIDDSPVGIFIEVAPIINVIPATDFDLDGGVGVRFYL